MDFFGRDNADEIVDQPFRGFTQALIRARIPFVPLHLDHLDRDAEESFGVDSAEHRRDVGLADRFRASDSSQRGGCVDRHRADQPVRSMGRSAIGFCAGGFVWRERRKSRRRDGRASRTFSALRRHRRFTPICDSRPELRGQVDGPSPATNRRSPSSAIRFSPALTRPISCPSAASLILSPSERMRSVLATFIPPFPSISAGNRLDAHAAH